MNKGKRWSTSENDLLISKVCNNTCLNNIALELGRTKGGLVKQLEKLLLNKNIDVNALYEQFLISNIKSNYYSDDQLSMNILDNKSHCQLDNVPSKNISDNISEIIENNLIQTEINFILDDIIDEIEETKDLNEEQLLCYNNAKNGKNLLITGSGGCHAINTEILMYDGTIKLVQDIIVNDLLMGDDSTPRSVLNLIRGNEIMYKIVNNKNESYIVNENHILCLKMTNNKIITDRKERKSYQVRWFDNKQIKHNSKTFSYKIISKQTAFNDATELFNSINEDLIVEISVKDFLNLTDNMQKYLNGYKIGIQFPEVELPLDPYMIGIWLGDGTACEPEITSQDSTVINYFKQNLHTYKCYLQFHDKYTYRINGDGTRNFKCNHFMNILKKFNLINNKHIPHIYKCNSRQNQLKILAGLIDSDGYFHNGTFEFTQSIEHERLIDDVIYLCRSLGFACYKNIKKTSWIHKGIKNYGNAFRIIISGNNIEEIPTLCPRKKALPRKQIKDVLVSGIKITKLENSEYYGFQLDGNHRYLMGNFIVTHNCGKSTVLKSIIKYLKRKNKNIGITSSTGISATLINGTTLHSFLKIGLATKSSQELYDKIIFNKPIYNKLKKLEVLIIDEISMIDNVLFNKIAAYLSLIKGIKKPFGKIQLILCGDFYQLPPVENTYCFNSNIWNRLNLQKIELKKQMRQIDDSYFQYMLEQVKINNITDDIFSKLSELKNKTIHSEIKPTILYSKNVDVNKINQNEFLKLVNSTNNKVFEFPIKFESSNSKIKTFIKNNPQYTETLKLCKGLQIMVTHNVDIKNKITNGTRGIITEINNFVIKIKTLDDSYYNIEYTKYENDSDENIIFDYIPLKLAYAITIHKSQGQTLDYVQISLGRDIFDYGMAYVALSRAKTLDSIVLSDLSKYAFKTNPEVIEFYNS